MSSEERVWMKTSKETQGVLQCIAEWPTRETCYVGLYNDIISCLLFEDLVELSDSFSREQLIEDTVSDVIHDPHTWREGK